MTDTKQHKNLRVYKFDQQKTSELVSSYFVKMLPKNIYNLNSVEGKFRELALINDKFVTNPKMPEIDFKAKKCLEVFDTEGEQ